MWWWMVGARAAPCALEVVDRRIPDPGLAFVARQATLAPTSFAAVDQLACLLAASPALRLQIEVHTDAMGADAYNLAMSQQRADALRDALLARGVDGGRVAASGCGEAYPLAPNTTAEGRARNARIELWAPSPPDRPACPRAAVPPPAAPTPPAPAAPAPPALPADCAAWTALSAGAPPTWAGLRCDGGPAPWACSVAAPPSAVVALASACVSGQWDGDVWLADRGGWALWIGPSPTGGAAIGAR